MGLPAERAVRVTEILAERVERHGSWTGRLRRRLAAESPINSRFALALGGHMYGTGERNIVRLERPRPITRAARQDYRDHSWRPVQRPPITQPDMCHLRPHSGSACRCLRPQRSVGTRCPAVSPENVNAVMTRMPDGSPSERSSTTFLSVRGRVTCVQ